MNEYHWGAQFRSIYDKMVAAYRKGTRDPDSGLDSDDVTFLRSIGCNTRELYDFAEDLCRYGEPLPETALLITAARRDYFLVIQKGRASKKVIDMDQLPAKDAQLGGITWLPRIIAKAEAKLRGEMPAELMFGCGGDRAFLEGVGIHPADFLRMVWAMDGDRKKILGWVRKHADNAGK